VVGLVLVLVMEGSNVRAKHVQYGRRGRALSRAPDSVVKTALNVIESAVMNDSPKRSYMRGSMTERDENVSLTRGLLLARFPATGRAKRKAMWNCEHWMIEEVFLRNECS
jgi:hypothetical protein